MIKNLLIICVLYLISPKILAQNPEKIYSITQVCKPNEFYIQQADAWKKVLDKDKKNADAWYYYYKASRYIQITNASDTTFNDRRFERLNNIVKEVEQNIPNTFEANMIKWANGGNDMKLFPYLEKAYQLAPERPESYVDLATYYEFKGNIAKREEFLKKWFDSGVVSPGLLNNNYNVLMSLKENAILITNGDNDTYPIWVLQAALGVRKDVKVLNTYMLYQDEYRARVEKELGISFPNVNESREKMQEFRENFVKILAKNKQHSDVSIALTCHPAIMQPVEANLYLVGLAYQYSEEKFDNLAVLKKNMEKHFALDYLKVSFCKDIAAGVVAMGNQNYVVPMLTLYDHYKMSEDLEKANYWKEMVQKVAKGTEMEKEVETHLKN